MAEGDFVAICGGISEEDDPSLFDDGLEEEATEVLDGLDEAFAVKLGRIQQFGFAVDGVEWHQTRYRGPMLGAQ